MTYHIWIGYDPTEDAAWNVAKFSLEKYATVPVAVHKLDHMDLRKSGMFTRRWEVDAGGQYLCQEDGKPFSTFFSHSRFLVPELWRNVSDPTKKDLALFLDCDWLFLNDIGSVLRNIEDVRLKRKNAHPVYCVQHDFKPSSDTKMHGVEQSKYNMKLWSSLMVFDMAHEDNALLLPEVVNSESGRWLHQFGWLTDVHRIEHIDESWNFVPGHSEKNCSNINAIHFSEGGPWHSDYRHCRYASLWHDAYNEYLQSKLKTIKFDTESMV